MGAPAKTTKLLIADLSPTATWKTVELPVPAGAVAIPGCDSMLQKTANGDILFFYLYAVGDPVTALGAKAAFDSWKYYNEGYRAAFVMWRSTDGGDHWKYQSPEEGTFGGPGKLAAPHQSPKIILDTALMDGWSATAGDYVRGEYGWPQDLNNEAHSVWFGGYDRPEVYCDPWHPNLIYLTAGVRSGTAVDAKGKALFPGHAQYQNVLFCSKDGGEVWSRPTMVDGVFNPPLEMTSTPPTAAHPNGRIYLLGYGPHAPYLRWSDDFGKTIKGGVECRVGSSVDNYFDCVEPEVLPLSSLKLAQFALARGISTDKVDTVRVAYSGTKGYHQNIIVVNVIVRSDGSTQVENGLTLTPTDAEHGHLLFPHFIETDQCGFMKGKNYNNVVLAWIECSRNQDSKLVLKRNNQVIAKGEAEELHHHLKNPYGTVQPYIKVIGPGSSTEDRTANQVCTRAVLFGQATEHELGPLSLLGPISAVKGGERDWNPQGAFFGDYVKGAFYSTPQGSLNYLIQYPSRDEPNPYQRLAFNVVSIGNAKSIIRSGGGGGR